MDDLLAAVFSAPVANLFIIGGLIFLGLGVVGTISGKIEPSKTGRIILSALGVLLIILGLVMHLRSEPAPTASVPTVSQAALPAATNAPVEPTTLPSTDAPAAPTLPALLPTAAPSLPPTDVPAPPTEAAPALPTALNPAGTVPMPAGSWQQILDLPRGINSLVVDPTNPQIVFAATGSQGSGSGVYKSEDGGLSWQLAANGLPSEDVGALAFSRGDSPLLYSVIGKQVYVSADGAATWQLRGAHDHFGGFYFSLYVDPTNPARLFLVSRPGGASRSLDGGQTWIALQGGLPADERGEVFCMSLALDPTDPNVVYAGTGGWVGNGHGVYKSVDGGETWSPANRGMLDYRIPSVVVSPHQSQTVYAGSQEGELFKSTDGGASWTKLTDRLPAQGRSYPGIGHMEMDPAQPDTIYLLSTGQGILASRDGGASWTSLGAPPEVPIHSLTAMAILFEPQPIVLIGIGDQGGWRYAAP